MLLLLSSSLQHMQVHQITQELQQTTLTATPAVTDSETMDKETTMLGPGTQLHVNMILVLCT